jgi:Arc/MetJ-type ribon-helix-helix transcriptional regulator
VVVVSLHFTPTMVSQVDQQTFSGIYLSASSTVNQQHHRLTLTQTPTTHLLRRQQLQLLPQKIEMSLVVVLVHAVLPVALVTVVPLSGARGAHRPLDAPRMHLSFVSRQTKVKLWLIVQETGP